MAKTSTTTSKKKTTTKKTTAAKSSAPSVRTSTANGKKSATSDTASSVKPVSAKIPYEVKIRNIYYTIWSIIGVIIIVIVAIGAFGGDSWSENLNLTEDSEVATQQPAPQQQPAGPDQEQLDCISDELGQDRLEELEMGAQAEEDEFAVIEKCLQ